MEIFEVGLSQVIFTSSMSTIKTLEKVVAYVKSY